MPIGHMRLTKVLMQCSKPALLNVFTTFLNKGKIIKRSVNATDLTYEYTIDHPDFLPNDEHAWYLMSPMKRYDGWNVEYCLGKLYKVTLQGDRTLVKDYTV